MTIDGIHRRTLVSGFLRSVERFPERQALKVQGQAVTYSTLASYAARLAQTLLAASPEDDPPLTALYGHRSLTAFAGILGILLRGHGYVPLNPAFPPARTRAMLERAGCRAVLVDAEASRQLRSVLEGIERPLTLLLPETWEPTEAEDWRSSFPQHRVLTAGHLSAVEDFPAIHSNPDAVAYLLFTSGSTGTPKGVMVSHSNVLHLLDFLIERYGIRAEDRLSQMFDLTFDPSAFNLFAAWEQGACVCCPQRGDLLMPARYLQIENLTVWFSVPSVVLAMKKMKSLGPGLFPSLRLSLFGGEPLPSSLLEAWGAAAPNSLMENLYGPTEMTIACTYYPWNPKTSPDECEAGIVPIGSTFPNLEALVVDEDLKEVQPGEPGELLITGPQRSLGYWEDAGRTALAFLVPPGRDEVFYRTGDQVRRPFAGKPMVFLGRVDHQVKIQGYRVELADIEANLRAVTGAEEAVVLSWPQTSSGAGGLVGFLPVVDRDAVTIREQLSDRLPPYMVPGQLRFLDSFPLNPNGKIDRNALWRRLEEEKSAGKGKQARLAALKRRLVAQRPSQTDDQV